MLIEFAVTNFLSFRDRQVFSLLPSGKIRERQILPLQAENYPKIQVLPTAVLYGPNNSGKSNFLFAVRALKWLVTNSGNFNSDKTLDANEFFGLNTQTKNQATIFEIDFISVNKKRYSYLISFNSTSVLQEELYVYNRTPEMVTVQTLFKRNKQDIKFSALKGVRASINFEPNQLFLSRADIAGNQEMKEVYSFFAHQFSVLQLTENEYTNFLTQSYANFLAKNPESKVNLLIEAILRETNTGILGIVSSLVDSENWKFPENVSQEIKDKIFEKLKYDLRTRHKYFDGEEEMGEETFPLSKQSTGTRKLVGLMPFIVSALEDGDTVFIDEMNTSMHTEITAWLIDLFNRPDTNPHKAQLIITTHDISLLDKELYEKDQIFVVEKNKYGASELYSFVDITGLRANNRLSDFYETGRLGGIPHIAKPYLQHLISQFLNDAQTKQQ